MRPGDRSGGAPERRPGEGALRPRTVAAAFALALVLGYLLLRLLTSQLGRLPFPDWPGAALVVALALLLIAAGWPIRRWRRGTLTRRLDPIRAFRTLILARAAAMSGAVVAGWYLAHAAVLGPEAASATVQRGIWWCLGYAAGGGLLVACGLVVQGWCRLDPPGGDPHGTVRDDPRGDVQAGDDGPRR